MNYLSEKTRHFIWQRAANSCEYCCLHSETVFLRHEIDHIISLKHGGTDNTSNLALACYYCNRYKGTDIGSIHKGRFIRFFNPRKDKWKNHFQHNGAVIEPLTSIGVITSKILGFNEVDRIMERQILIDAGKYPYF